MVPKPKTVLWDNAVVRTIMMIRPIAPINFSLINARLKKTHQSRIRSDTRQGPMKPAIRTPKEDSSASLDPMRNPQIKKTNRIAGQTRNGRISGLVASVTLSLALD